MDVEEDDVLFEVKTRTNIALSLRHEETTHTIRCYCLFRLLLFETSLGAVLTLFLVFCLKSVG